MRMRIASPIISATLLLMPACHKKPVRPTVSGPAPAAAASETMPPRSFRDGEASFQSGNYAEAARYYERFIHEDPAEQYKDVAMFRLAMTQALVCTTAECRSRSMDQFRRLVARFPLSPYSAEARVVLSLQTDIDKVKADARLQEEKIKKLTDELEKLKKIDLERSLPRIKK